MKKFIKIALVLTFCVFLSGCGKTVEDHLIGQWKYDTGLAVWDFVFEEDGAVRFTSSRHWTVGTYEINEKRQSIRVSWVDEDDQDEHEWLFSYEETRDGIDLIHALGWHFTKIKSYDARSERLEYEKYEMMSEDVYDEVEALIKSGDAEDYAIRMLGIQYPDVTFQRLEITSGERNSYYTYSVYGKIYSQDKFGDKYVDKVEVMYRAEKEADGYTIHRYLYKYDENNNIIP